MQNDLLPGYVPLNVARNVQLAGRSIPSRCAISADNRHFTYAQLAERIERVRVGVQSTIGASVGKRALILAPDCIEYIEIVLGVSEAGMATATPSYRLAKAELAAIIADCTPEIIFAHHTCVDILPAVNLPNIIIGAGYEEWLAVPRTATPPLHIDECAPFSIPYTSGTTGRPKGVLLSHRSRVLTAHATAVEYGCFGPSDSHLANAPLCHGAGFAFALAALSFGGRLELMGSFDPERAIRKLSTEAFTSTFMVPTHFHSIFELNEAVRERYRAAPSLKTIISNAAPLPTATKEKIIAYWGEGKLFECYGSTENGIVSNLRPADQLLKQQCVGVPFPNTEIAILDEALAPVAEGTIGKIYTRSPYVFNGYLNRVEEPGAESFRNGWATVGDLGRRDEDGFLYIMGRAQDMVISGGINVYPKEVEDVIARHGAVVEAAVVGIPDAHWGEALRAFIVLRSGALVTAEDIVALCRRELASFKVPKSIRFIDALPKSGTGKILKRQLAAIE